jgi:RNA polymerase sigma factor (sigma-70 family)
MARNPLRETLNHLRQILPSSREDALSDGQLLTRFVATRDEAAFAALVQRHGPMVLGICRQVLRRAQDAEDAFQASFLVLARKAASIANRQTVASWLYRVSYRIALEARAINDRRRAREKQVEDVPHPQTMPAEIQDWRPSLDHELNRLPEKYRTTVLLCDLEGAVAGGGGFAEQLGEALPQLADAQALQGGDLIHHVQFHRVLLGRDGATVNPCGQ